MVKVKVTLEQAIKVQKGSRGTLYSCFNLGARWGLVVKATFRPYYPRKRHPINNVQETGWGPGPGWTRVEISPPTHQDSIPWPSASSESLYRLSYPGPSYARDACAEASEVLVIAARSNRIWTGKGKVLGKSSRSLTILDTQDVVTRILRNVDDYKLVDIS